LGSRFNSIPPYRAKRGERSEYLRFAPRIPILPINPPMRPMVRSRHMFIKMRHLCARSDVECSMFRDSFLPLPQFVKIRVIRVSLHSVFFSRPFAGDSFLLPNSCKFVKLVSLPASTSPSFYSRNFAPFRGPIQVSLLSLFPPVKFPFPLQKNRHFRL
jgi:hypothetical protein